MKYTAAKNFLLQLAQQPGAEVLLPVQRDEVSVRQRLASAGSVTADLKMRLTYGRKRGHVHLATGIYLSSPDLITHPDTEAFQHSVSDMPFVFRQEVMALRRELNGSVSYLPPELLPYEELFRTFTGIEQWSEDRFFEHLLLVFALSSAVATRRLPASTGAGLLAWAKGSVPSGPAAALAQRIMNGWKAASGAAGGQNAA